MSHPKPNDGLHELREETLRQLLALEGITYTPELGPITPHALAAIPGDPRKKAATDAIVSRYFTIKGDVNRAIMAAGKDATLQEVLSAIKALPQAAAPPNERFRPPPCPSCRAKAKVTKSLAAARTFKCVGSKKKPGCGHTWTMERK